MSNLAIHQVSANGLTFAYFEQGEGPLAICLHGFPDTAHTWLDLMPHLAAAGFRVVAPFMRGYPPTEAPQDANYSALQLGDDVGALITALGAEKACVIGHDWGALATYAAANMHSEKITKMVTAAIPHPRTIKFSLGSAWKARHFITFQFRRWAKWRLRRNRFNYVDTIYRRWSPTWQLPANETRFVKEAFAKEGAIEAALGYYWSFAATQNDKEVQRLVGKKTSVPTLCVVGNDDGALDMSTMPATATAYTGPYSYEILPNAGHFLHRESPELFAKLVLEFLHEPPK